jgi:NAD(P)-dependent dehydrogenase (short-subunit alcohol dehydrogenase family)
MADGGSARRVALVTGAGSGLGAATVRALIDAGYAIAALDVDPSRLSALAGQPETLALACDITDAGAVDARVADIVTRFGRIDVAINCAGVDHTYWLEQLTLAQFDQIIAVNLRGPFVVAKAVWPVMKRQGGGQIVNIASTAALRVWPGASAYHASKFGVLGLSRALNLEGRSDGIRVMTVIPGGMDTRFFDRFKDQNIPQPDPGSLQSPANVARTIVYALGMPADSVLQEIVITHPDEPGWP